MANNRCSRPRFEKFGVWEAWARVLFFTGDVVYSSVIGESMSDQYQLAHKFYNPVRKTFEPEISLRI